MHFSNFKMALPVLLAVAPSAQAGKKATVLDTRVGIQNDSGRDWEVEAKALPATFVVADTYQGESLVASSRTFGQGQSLRFKVKANSKINIQLATPDASVSAAFHLRDHLGNVAPVACLTYQYQAPATGCFAWCFAPAQEQAKLWLDLDDDVRQASGMDDSAPQTVRITHGQWPAFKSGLNLDQLLGATVGPVWP